MFVSGIQRLFSSTPSSLSPYTQRGQRQLESVTEEAHTYDLLYPEGDVLSQGQHHVYPLRHGDPASIAAAASSTDDRGGLDIQSPRDIRIVIAQDANTRSPHPRALYDSHPPVQLSQSRNAHSPESVHNGRPRAESFSGESLGGLTGGGMRSNNAARKPKTAPHTRQSSLSQTNNSVFTSPGSPLSPVSELGGLFGNVKGRSTSVRPATSDGESAQGRAARESREETEALLDCMFGAATGFPSTSSTKLHIRPPKSKDSFKENRPNSATQESASATAFPKRRTPLTRSTTAAEFQALSVDPSQRSIRQPSSAIWITRLFSVDPNELVLAEKAGEDQSPKEQSQHGGVDAATETGSTSPVTKKEKAKQLKTPTYAIAIVLQMPIQRQRPLAPSSPIVSGHISGNSISLPFDGSTNIDMPESNNDIGYVLTNWVVLNRALAALEAVARCKIIEALSRLDLPYRRSLTKDATTPSELGPKISPRKKKLPTQWTLQLPAGALQDNPGIQGIIGTTGRRVALALKTRKVVVGQGRWGIWREEARRIYKWAGEREQNFFLFNLLTAFVGSHTAWLDSLAPKDYRRQLAKVSEKGRKENNILRHRTVVICPDKMSGRRLIFLLAAFFPGAHLDFANGGQDLSHHRPYVVESGSHKSISQQSSSSKLTNRKVKPSPAYDASHGRAISFSESDSTPIGDPSTNERRLGHSRRSSDTRSASSAALLISTDGSVTRKSSTTTTATIKPDASVPVAHFAQAAAGLQQDANAAQQSGSVESLAPLSLQRTLSRSDSHDLSNASAESQSKSGWGSLVSFWSGRRGSSTEDSDPLTSSGEGLGISGVSHHQRNRRPRTKLTDMVDEVTAISHNADSSANPLLHGVALLAQLDNTNHCSESPTNPRQVLKRPLHEPYPLKLSVDESDGIVEVDLPPAGSYPSSFGSIASSPAMPQTAASSWNDSCRGRGQPLPIRPSNSGVAGNVAGWLRNYHEDFILQAVRPYSSLKDDIKRSMRTEPPNDRSLSEADAYDWSEVCSTIIADTTTFTITRLTLRRKNSKSPHHRANALLNIDANPNEEQMLEEPLMDMDPIFIDAVERVLSHSGDSSRVASRNPSRAPSPTRHRERTPTENSPGLEIPRSRCKSMVLGALEEVARSVGDELTVQGQAVKDVGNGRKRKDIPAESTLREGVRKWFCEVEKPDP